MVLQQHFNCCYNRVIFFVLIFPFLFDLTGCVVILPENCKNLNEYLHKVNGSSKKTSYTIQCQKEGPGCTKYSCQVHFVKVNKTITLKGLFECQTVKPAFVITLIDGNTNKKTTVNNHTSIAINGLNAAASITFGRPDSTTGATNVSGSLSMSLNDVSIKFPDISLSVPNLVCTCSNLNNLGQQLLGHLKDFSRKVEISCWPYGTNCSSFVCNAEIQVPNSYFKIHGSVYCNENNTEIYQLSLHGVMKPSTTIKNTIALLSNTSGTDTMFSQTTPYGGGFSGSAEIKVNVSFEHKNNSKTLMTSGVAAEYKMINGITKNNNVKVTFNVSLDFDLNCKASLITPAPTTTTTTKAIPTINSIPNSATNSTTKPTTNSTTKPTEPTTNSTTNSATNSTTNSTTKPITEPATNSTTKPTTEPTSKSTKSTKKDKSKHGPAKAVLIVLAVLIVITVIMVGIYLKRRKRLSNQPAYYNDIAINDPLRYELDEGDDDELPLFS